MLRWPSNWPTFPFFKKIITNMSAALCQKSKVGAGALFGNYSITYEGLTSPTNSTWENLGKKVYCRSDIDMRPKRDFQQSTETLLNLNLKSIISMENRALESLSFTDKLNPSKTLMSSWIWPGQGPANDRLMITHSKSLTQRENQMR